MRGALDRQFADFLATWDGSKELRELFINPAIPAAQKVAILDKLNAKMGLQRELRNLIAVLINNDRIGEVHEVASRVARRNAGTAGHPAGRDCDSAAVE